MYRAFAEMDVGKRNVAFGIGLFVLMGVGGGIPLTIDFFGGSIFTAEQYQTWKVVHGYSVFLAFINYFFGVTIDRWQLNRRQKQLASWSLLIAGLSGGMARPILALFGVLSDHGVWASLGEVVFITLGTYLFVVGQLKGWAATRTPEVKTLAPTEH